MKKTLSLETAKKLTEAGIVLDTELYHMTVGLKKEQFYRKLSFEPCNKTAIVTKHYMINEKPETMHEGNKNIPIYSETFEFNPAPDIPELLEALPDIVNACSLELYRNEGMWRVSYVKGSFELLYVKHKELVESLAQALLWVNTQKTLEVKDE
jgi:hypothetical protein